MDKVIAQITGISEITAAGQLSSISAILCSIVLGAISFLIFIIFIAYIRYKLLPAAKIRQQVTWDCGYMLPTARMQYTSSSFAQPLIDLFKMFLRTHHKAHMPTGIFPQEASYSTHTPDSSKEYLFRPLICMGRYGIKQAAMASTRQCSALCALYRCYAFNTFDVEARIIMRIASLIIQPVLAFILAPLLLGIINRTKAIFAGRRGQPILQLYYDLWKLLHKGSVYSRSTSWVFRAAPIIGLAAVSVATLIVPLGHLSAPLAFEGDLILLAYILALMRFFIVIGALDTASAFEGMGASREVTFSALAEPASAFIACGDS